MDFILLNLVLCHALKGIGKERTVGARSIRALLIQSLPLGQHRFLHLVRDSHRPHLGAVVQCSLSYLCSPPLAELG